MKKISITHRLPFALVSLNVFIPLFLAMFITIHGVEHVHAAPADTPQKAAALPKVQATVRTVDPANNALVIKMNKKSSRLLVTPQTKITSRDGQPIPLADVSKRDEVKVAWSDNGGKLIAEEISVILPAQYKKNGKAQGQGQGQGRNKAQSKG